MTLGQVVVLGEILGRLLRPKQPGEHLLLALLGVRLGRPHLSKKETALAESRPPACLTTRVVAVNNVPRKQGGLGLGHVAHGDNRSELPTAAQLEANVDQLSLLKGAASAAGHHLLCVGWIGGAAQLAELGSNLLLVHEETGLGALERQVRPSTAAGHGATLFTSAAGLDRTEEGHAGPGRYSYGGLGVRKQPFPAHKRLVESRT